MSPAVQSQVAALLPVLVECPPLSAKLREGACLSRYRAAKTIRPRKGSGLSRGNQSVRNAAKRRNLSVCQGCPLGAKRDLAKRAPAR